MTSPPRRPEPLRLEPLSAPDADHATLVRQAMARVSAHTQDTWTDLNASDPGITVLEAIAFGFADAHYRVAGRGLDHWPTAPLTTAEERPTPGELLTLARFLARPEPGGSGVSVATELTRIAEAHPVAAARDKVVRLARDASVALPPRMVDACLRVLRRPRLQAAALGASDLVAAAIDEATAGLPAGATDDDRAATARQLLHRLPPLASLFADELALLVERERDRRALPASAALAARLVERVEDTEHDPESHEAFGATTVWPPTPDQALRCEPVTGDDYAARARNAAEVARAWAVAGAQPGVAWHGDRTVVTDRAGVVTVVVERVAPRVSARTDEAFLKSVLDDILEEDYDRYTGLGRRRLFGDELGIALVRHYPVALSGRLHTPLGVDRAVVMARARARVAAYFAAGRPESRTAARYIGPGRGPWPTPPASVGGWTPGAAIPVTELVQVLAADPSVLGVSDVRAVVHDGPVVKAPVRVRAGTARASLQNLGQLDGVALAGGDRVLLTAQDPPSDNGIWVATPGPWQRADDAACDDCVVNAVVRVTEGSEAGKVWAMVSDPPVRLHTEPLIWERTDRSVLPDVRAVTTTPVTLSGQPQVGGVWLFAGDTVLVTGQADPVANGVYTVAAGAWTRLANSSAPGTAVRVAAGVDSGSTWWSATPAPVTAGTTPQRWVRSLSGQPADGRPAGELVVPPGGVPVLASRDCLEVHFELGTEDADAQS